MKDYDKRKDLNIFERNEQLKILRFIEKKDKFIEVCRDAYIQT